MKMMISVLEYLQDPCGTLSIPYWKAKNLRLPENMRVVHDRDFPDGGLPNFTDQRYFRLYHDLHSIPCAEQQDIALVTATEQDVDTIVSVINQCYDDIRVNRQQLIRYRQTPVYCADLWVLAVSRTENICVGAGIADYDRELGELVLEWIQVLPAYRNRKIGQEIVCELLRRMRGTAKFATVSGQANNPSRPEFLYRKCGFTGTDVWHVLSAK
ncbi:MAG TPA: GNAT family N-acetyltransferase [Candidatus Merdivicinus intestinigallinarum]|nr:GNAT family N-acetyltransferase [Candidatus Merdivicinus intestinigallinarum]